MHDTVYRLLLTQPTRREITLQHELSGESSGVPFVLLAFPAHTELVERCAKAAYQTDYPGTPWEDAGPERQDQYRGYVNAVLRTMQ